MFMKNKICKVDGCDKIYYAKSYCQKHYRRFKAHGNPLFTKYEMHGMWSTPEYQIWKGMIQRCFNTKNKKYHRYGGRGITVCDRWKNSFLDFYKDMGDKPTNKQQIDRIDNDGNYEPSNCEWVTPLRNKRKTRRIKLSMEIAREIRKDRLKNGMKRKDLSDKYHITISQIDKILYNKIWKDSQSPKELQELS